jgi:hypothetical protein
MITSKDSPIPFVGVGNDELEELPELLAGQLIVCKRCGKKHRVIDGEPAGIIQGVRCGSKLFVVGIKGRLLK